MKPWNLQDMPSLVGRRAVVTGVTSGLGLRTATELARAGAQVVLAARDPERLSQTARDIAAEIPDAALTEVVCDLADLASVRQAAAQISDLGALDLLVNNAGVMGTPFGTTKDGFELQFGTNHLGHFALTGLLLPALTSSPNPRVVSVASQMARLVTKPRLEDPTKRPRPYSRWRTYGQTKLSNLLFTMELDRRVHEAGIVLTAVAAHPGYAHTNLVRNGLARSTRLQLNFAEGVTSLVAQSAEMGALPSLMAATAPGLRGGTYVGPLGPGQLNGYPGIVSAPTAAYNEANAAALWDLSQIATGVTYP